LTSPGCGSLLAPFASKDVCYLTALLTTRVISLAPIHAQVVPAGPLSDRTCRTLTTCVRGREYERVAASATSDRICVALRACTDNEFQSMAPTTTSDRTCTTHTSCTAAEYEVSAGTALVDRRCAPLTVCQLGREYASTAATNTTDRVCTALTVCKEEVGGALVPFK